MTTFTWFGGDGKYDAARNWTPKGVPGAGDFAVISAGEVVVQRHTVAAALQLGGTDPNSPPMLALHRSSVSALSMPAALPQPPYTTTPPAEYATVNAFGHTSIGSIDIGSFEDEVRAPNPYGHGPLGAQDSMTVNLHGKAALSTSFDVNWGSTLTVNGAGKAAFNVANSTVAGGNVVINSSLGGAGTILLTHGPIDYTGFGFTGSLELGGSVGSGDTIDIRMGNLLIDKPMQFSGKIDFENENLPPPPGERYSFGGQSALLKGITATSYSFDDSSHTMTLYNADTIVDLVHFTPDMVASSFGPNAAIDVAQTANGVFLRGAFSHLPNGATEIPVRT